MPTTAPASTSPLRVTPPPYPSVESSREATRQKLARNVAALFGIPVVDSKYPEACWIADYRALNIKDLARGTPPGWDPNGAHGGSLDLTPVASATLSKFGPDVKAAAVLLGANELFESVRPTMSDILDITYLAEDEHPVADATRVALWAALQADVFMAQPALMWAVYQARTIQRATDYSWAVQVEDECPAGEARRQVEFTSGSDGDPSLQPRSVSILDELMKDKVQPQLGPTGTGEEDIAHLVDNTVTRFVSQLMRDSAYAGWAKLKGTSPGRRHLDVYLHREGLHGTFMEENLRIFRKVHPLRVSGDDTGPRGDGGDDKSWEDFDPSNVSHWLRVLPRVPSKFEVRRLAPTSQVALIRALREVVRCVAEFKDELPPQALTETRHRMLQLCALSEAVLGPSHHESHRIFLLYSELLVRALNFGHAAEWDRFSDREPLDQVILQRIDELHGLAESWPPAEWLECWDQVSTVQSNVIERFREVGQSEMAQRVNRQQTRTWLKAFSAMGVDPLNDEAHDTVSLAGLASPLHDCMATLLRPGETREQIQRARELGLGHLLPARRHIADLRKSDRPLRYTLQVLLRHFTRSVEEGEHELIPALRRLRQDLLGTSRVEVIRNRSLQNDFGNLTPSDFITMKQLVNSALTLIEHGGDSVTELPDVRWQLQACRHVIRQQSEPGVSSPRAQEFDEMLQRWSDLIGDQYSIDFPAHEKAS